MKKKSLWIGIGVLCLTIGPMLISSPGLFLPILFLGLFSFLKKKDLLPEALKSLEIKPIPYDQSFYKYQSSESYLQRIRKNDTTVCTSPSSYHYRHRYDRW